jgi:hypothetical protein
MPYRAESDRKEGDMAVPKWLGVVAGALLLTVAPAALADSKGDPGGCNFPGSWIGYGANGVAAWMSTAAGLTASSGTYTLDIPGFDATLTGMFPDAVTATTLRGTWVRTGGNTIAFTVVGLAVDAEGETVWIGKLSGTDTISDSCSSIHIRNTLEVFVAGQDPFNDSTPYVIPLPEHDGYRMRVDPPAVAGTP